MSDAQLGPELEFSNQIDGPFVITFTARLPFVLGIPSDVGHIISFAATFVDREAAAAFGERAFVRMRAFNSPLAGLLTFLNQTMPVIKHFYSFDAETANEAQADSTDGIHEYEQWVTLETPYALAQGENVADRALAFHRCLHALNLFFRAVLVITRDTRIRGVSSLR